MACCLFSHYLKQCWIIGTLKQTSVKFESKYNDFYIMFLFMIMINTGMFRCQCGKIPHIESRTFCRHWVYSILAEVLALPIARPSHNNSNSWISLIWLIGPWESRCRSNFESAIFEHMLWIKGHEYFLWDFLSLPHLPWTKWTPFRRQYFQMHFCESFWFKFHWSLFPRFQLTITQHWFR